MAGRVWLLTTKRLRAPSRLGFPDSALFVHIHYNIHPCSADGLDEQNVVLGANAVSDTTFDTAALSQRNLNHSMNEREVDHVAAVTRRQRQRRTRHVEQPTHLLGTN